jgi:predicted NACHT family NTPase
MTTVSGYNVSMQHACDSYERYEWERFWCPRGQVINLADGGYLYDPRSDIGRRINPQIVPLAVIAQVPCLALLGEPGIGKSVAMAAEKERLDEQIRQSGAASLWIDLRQFQTDALLYKLVFESPAFRSWVEGTHELHLFLDSLDECLLRIGSVASLLLNELQGYPIDRLHIRIACRTADWPSFLEEGLRGLWGRDQVGVAELAPLRRADVALAARANSLDDDAFLAEIADREAVPLAIKPVTLQLLLNLYHRGGRLPATQAALYLQGCRLLCDETSEGRRAGRLTGKFNPDERLAIAERIAAVLVFANRYAVWTEADRGDVPLADVTIEDLCGEAERAGGTPVQVDRDAVQEVLGTGLFSARGPNQLGFFHQTIAEFLAARYLLAHQLTAPQRRSLILHDGRVVPQLREAAAWLASMSVEVFRELIESDPEVLFRSDAASADVKDRQALVGALLTFYDEERAFDWGYDQWHLYRKLAHPDLADQLRPFIHDRAKGIVVRRVAVGLAEACQLQELQDDLVRLALDRTENFQVRVNAAYAIGRIADAASKRKLLPLARGEAGDDPADELKGCALKALWPGLISAPELFALITPPKDENLLGAYRGFLLGDEFRQISLADLVFALEWIAQQQPLGRLPHSFDTPGDSFMYQAWQGMDQPGILDAFARAAITRLQQHDRIVGGEGGAAFGQSLRDNPSKRRRLLEAIVHLLPAIDLDPMWLVYGDLPLATPDDTLWMVERLSETVQEPIQAIWAKLIGRVYDWRQPEQTEAIMAASQQHAVLAEEFAWWFTPVLLDSPEAAQLRETYQMQLEDEERRHARPQLVPPPAERVEQHLSAFEAGDLSSWWCLNMELTLEPDSTHYQDELEARSCQEVCKRIQAAILGSTSPTRDGRPFS